MDEKRPHHQQNGVLTRQVMTAVSSLERSIQHLVWEVEKLGASAALTDTVRHLCRARERLADHLEGIDVDVHKM